MPFLDLLWRLNFLTGLKFGDKLCSYWCEEEEPWWYWGHMVRLFSPCPPLGEPGSYGPRNGLWIRRLEGVSSQVEAFFALSWIWGFLILLLTAGCKALNTTVKSSVLLAFKLKMVRVEKILCFYRKASTQWARKHWVLVPLSLYLFLSKKKNH